MIKILMTKNRKKIRIGNEKLFTSLSKKSAASSLKRCLHYCIGKAMYYHNITLSYSDIYTLFLSDTIKKDAFNSYLWRSPIKSLDSIIENKIKDKIYPVFFDNQVEWESALSGEIYTSDKHLIIKNAKEEAKMIIESKNESLLKAKELIESQLKAS